MLGRRRSIAAPTSGVSTMLRLIRTPASVAVVRATPKVSAAKIAARIVPVSVPAASSARPGGRRVAAAIASTETSIRAASTTQAWLGLGTSALTARYDEPQVIATPKSTRSTYRRVRMPLSVDLTSRKNKPPFGDESR